MNNKKGFTLIELLVVVAILAVVGTVVTVSLNATLKSSKREQCNRYVEEIEKAACVYAGLSANKELCNRNNCPPVNLNTLVDEGLLEIQKDACTKNDMNLSNTVSITWTESGEKQCRYNGVRNYEG